ncbi:MAG: undecaprenyl-diphosphate phosphatase [Caldisericia bacterium]|jgi:undecaprenyl-diphosphatase|nr:undecaprenyl-diphosphate phosphatase [Caldisericia bacterium]
MKVIQSIILGIVQGLTEFLPVSSTGHIILFSRFLNLKEPPIFYDLTLHLGTLIAVFIFFYPFIIKNIKNIKLIFLILISTITTGIFYIIFKEPLEALFSNFKYLPIFFLITSFYLFFFYFKNRRYKTIKEMTLFDSIIIGLSQGFAIIPGISRSGFTFITSLLLGIKEEDAFRYSFLLSIPSILGASVLKYFDYIKSGEFFSSNIFLSGFFMSLIFGIIAIIIFKSSIFKRNFRVYSIYLIIVAIIIMIWFW